MSEVFVHPSATVEEGVVLGPGTKVWAGAHIRRGARIGRDCIVGGQSYIAYGVTVGDRVKINQGAYLCHGVEIGDGVMVAAHVVFTNDRSPRACVADLSALRTSEPDEHTERCVVEDGASLGANATIGPGLRIGRYAMVGMGSVLTKDVPAHGLALGNPARVVGAVARDGACVWRGDWPPADGTTIECPGDGVLVVEGGMLRHRAG